MKLSTLKNKLNKMNIEFKIESLNEFNQEINFSLNGTEVSGDFNSRDLKVTSFSSVRGYCHSSQETLRSFYNNFAHVQRRLFK